MSHPDSAYIHPAPTARDVVDVLATELLVLSGYGLLRFGAGAAMTQAGLWKGRADLVGRGTALMFELEGAAAAGGAGGAATAAQRGSGTRNPSVRASVYNGNEMHYDCLNGGRGYAGSGVGAPSQLQRRFPQTLFRFTRRGERGADVYYVSGKHPSSYAGSSWPKGVDVADFKPYTPSGLKAVAKEIRAGKLPPGTFPIYYEQYNGVLRTP